MLVLAMLCVAEYSIVRQMTDEALSQTEEILKMVRQGELDEGLKKAQALDAFWDKHARKLEILADHSDVEEVNRGISRMIAALEGKDRPMAMIYACEVEKSARHVRERQALSIQNVL